MSDFFNQQDVATHDDHVDTLSIVEPTTLVSVVLQQMQQTQTSCVLVVENKRLVGIFTERDVVRTIASRTDPNTLPISALMSSQVMTLSEAEADDLSIVLQRFRHDRVRHLPIVDEAGWLVGIKTPESVRRILQPSDLLRMRRVYEVMETRVICAAPTTTIEEIAQQMETCQVSCIVITDLEEVTSASGNRFPIGIVTERDLVRFWALGLDAAQTPVQQVMSTPLILMCPSETLWHANQHMQYHQIRRLVVVGATGELKGILTQTRLLQALDPVEMVEAIQSLQRLITQKEQAFQRESARRKQVEVDLEQVNQTMRQTIEQLVFQQTNQLQNEIKLLHQRNQKLEKDLQNYIDTESTVEQLLKNRYFRKIDYELKTSVSHIRMGIEMLEIILKRMGISRQAFPLLDSYFQILKNECENGIQVLAEIAQLKDEQLKGRY